MADKVSCVLKHLRRIRDNGVRRRQATRDGFDSGGGLADDDVGCGEQKHEMGEEGSEDKGFEEKEEGDG